MRKQKRTSSKVGGPFLAAAFYCDGIIEGKDGSLSVMKIIDGCKIEIAENTPAEFPSPENPIHINPSALITFRTGDSPGPHVVGLVLEGPDGHRQSLPDQKFDLENTQHGGVNIRTHLGISTHTSGIFWLDVYLDGKLVTRMPFNLQIQRLKQQVKPKISSKVKHKP